MKRGPRGVAGAVLAAIGVTCLLAACGGDDAGSEETRLRADVTHALTTKDPAACTTHATQRFLEQMSGLRGKAALRECRAEAADEPHLRSFAFARVKVSGARASVAVRPKGRDSEGVDALEFKLRKAGDRWQLDRLSGGRVDRDTFLRELRQGLMSSPDALSRASADCVVRRLRRGDDALFLRAIVDGSGSFLVLPLATCLIRNEISREGVDKGFVRCVDRRIHRALSTGVLGRRLASRGIEVLETKAFDRAANRIIAGCARERGLSAAP